MQLVALTGGIAAGKSLVAARLGELGAVIVDADVLARQAVAPGSPGLAQVVAVFGAGVLQEDGSLDRAALGALVFGDAERLARLNAIVHPEVQRLAHAAFAAAEAADPEVVVVYDIPLLAETIEDRDEPFDRIVVVSADEATRLRRMIEHRGMTEEAARARVAAQAPEAARLALASDVIRNDGDVAEVLAEVDALWERIRARSDVRGPA